MRWSLPTPKLKCWLMLWHAPTLHPSLLVAYLVSRVTVTVVTLPLTPTGMGRLSLMLPMPLTGEMKLKATALPLTCTPLVRKLFLA